MKRLLLVVVVAFGALVPATVAVAAAPATMTGETLTVAGGPSTVFCTPSAGGNFSFTASGVATGPYAGTFTETGAVTVSGTRPAVKQVTAFSAEFVIYSPAGDVLVRGTKQLNTAVPNASTACLTASGDLGANAIPATYEATIYTASGNFRDMGTSLVDAFFSNGSASFFRENFLSSLSQPTLIAPSDKSQCKSGGWQNYPQFKNQGDCVSYVASGGQNPPANSS